MYEFSPFVLKGMKDKSFEQKAVGAQRPDMIGCGPAKPRQQDPLLVDTEFW
jgi:hypothetical protein